MAEAAQGESAARLAGELTQAEAWGQGSLTDALLKRVRDATSLDVKRSDFKLDMVPADEREARAAIALPGEACLCRIDTAPRPVAVASLSPADALYQALVLGLCTPWLYNPARPVLWTRASLTRQLELFDGRGFYA